MEIAAAVLEVDGSNALVQLFESAVGINLSNSKVRFWVAGLSYQCLWICRRVLMALENQDGGPEIIR